MFERYTATVVTGILILLVGMAGTNIAKSTNSTSSIGQNIAAQHAAISELLK